MMKDWKRKTRQAAEWRNLRLLRHAKGLSQDDLACEAEVSRSYLSQLEKGAFYASLKIVGNWRACWT
jgi:transcriptional regulator with XRE-family HTH domain